MKTLRIIGYAMVLFFFSAFKSTSACEYAGSNINFVKTQTEKALAKDDLNLVRYYAFKALNAIEKSKKQMGDCKCEYASISVEESAYLIKRATKLSNIQDAKELLKRALENAQSSIEALKIHDKEHTRNKTGKLLAINTGSKDDGNSVSKVDLPLDYKKRIDTALERYQIALDKVVQTVNCKEATEFAEKIYNSCEQELLKEGLSESKKYYNLRTQEITAKALESIKTGCER